jgi:hypothetical protein
MNWNSLNYYSELWGKDTENWGEKHETDARKSGSSTYIGVRPLFAMNVKA